MKTVQIVMPSRRPPGSARVEAIMFDEMRQAAGEVGNVLEASTHAVMSPDRKTGRSIRETRARATAQTTSRIELTFVTGQVTIWLDQGTGIYGRYRRPIVPRRARALRIPVPGGGRGQAIFRSSVRGVRPRRYFDRALRTAEPQVALILERARVRMAQRISL